MQRHDLTDARLWQLTVAALIGSVVSLFAMTAAVDHPGSLPALLGNEMVRKELAMSSLQAAVLKSLRGEYQEAVREITDPMPKNAEARVEAEKKLLALNIRFNERALSVLNASQRKRFLEIEHQVLGARALTTPAVQSALKLTDQQQRKIEAIRKKGLVVVGKINRKFAEKRIDSQERLKLLQQRRISRYSASEHLSTSQ